MPEHYAIVEDLSDWKKDFPTINLITATDYLSKPGRDLPDDCKLFNFCHGYSYLSVGYYCSLLAEAREHKVLPSIRSLRDLSSRSLSRLEHSELELGLNQSLCKFLDQECAYDAFILFGSSDEPKLDNIARQLFERFRCPLIKLSCKRDSVKEAWTIHSVRPLRLSEIRGAHKEHFTRAMENYMPKRWVVYHAPRFRYDLAILHDPADKLPPSDSAAIKKMIRAGKKVGLGVELIEKKDLGRLAEYDALFIRETTAIDHHTYLFAKRAEKAGMVVIDDPTSILRCTNKVYLSELLSSNRVRTPHTVIFQDYQLDYAEEQLGYPMILKIPDGAFSRGIHKVKNRKELEEISTQLFKSSGILVAQEFLYTEFDWRIGVLNNKALYACQYLMCKNHWQIYQHGEKGKVKSGGFKTPPMEDVPPEVIRTALKATKLIGDGLYGVDLKHNERGVFVIEVNDNPSIDDGVENLYLKDELYTILMKEFLHRCEIRGNRNKK